MHKEHHLKVWPSMFDAIADGRKPFEFRKNDRDFNTGDTLVLQEWNPDTKEYTGRECCVKVSMVLRGGQFGIPEGYVIMAITLVEGDPRDLLRNMEKVVDQLMKELSNTKSANWGFVNETLIKVTSYLRNQ